VLRIDGRSFSRSPIDVLPVWKRASPETGVIGTADSRFGRAMRELVTITSSTCCAIAADGVPGSAAATAMATVVCPLHPCMNRLRFPYAFF
jgi:hypothetical protein